MNIESLIVGIIILIAGIYVSSLAMKKFFRFKKKESCGINCGCDSYGFTKYSHFISRCLNLNEFGIAEEPHSIG